MERECCGFLDLSQLVIPATFAECLTYEEQICYLAKKVEDLEQRIEVLERGVSHEQM